MSNLIGQPPQQTSVDSNGDSVSQPWATWFNSVFTLLTALTQSGTTAQRPTKVLWRGRTYWDVTLGRPIWYSGTAWVFSDGTPA